MKMQSLPVMEDLPENVWDPVFMELDPNQGTEVRISSSAAASASLVLFWICLMQLQYKINFLQAAHYVVNTRQ